MLLLASASPRRVELLRAAGYEFSVVPADVDEAALIEPNPWRTARATALAKARAVHAAHPGATVIGGDTVVAVKDGGRWTLLGKPEDDEDAARMLRHLNGREHTVVTGVAVVTDAREEVSSKTSRVRIELTEAEIAAYIATGEPNGKAGAYAIQSGQPGIALVGGPLDNVIGLPIELVRRLLRTPAHSPARSPDPGPGPLG